MDKNVFTLSLSLLLLISGIAGAQSFGDSRPTSNASAFGLETEQPKKAPQAKIEEKPTVTKAETPDLTKLKTFDEIEKALLEEQEKIRKEREDIFMPNGGVEKLLIPTTDGSQRGELTLLETDADGQTKANSKIFMYLEDFAISGAVGNSVTCDMRFVILTNLDQKLVSLDVKFVWPGMTTVVSYANVLPNTPTAYMYTLMGDGCYTMDKSPNIIVNRCRVKGMNSAECADRIVWLTDSK